MEHYKSSFYFYVENTTDWNDLYQVDYLYDNHDWIYVEIYDTDDSDDLRLMHTFNPLPSTRCKNPTKTQAKELLIIALKIVKNKTK